MGVNLVLLDGVVNSLALRYDNIGKPELRFTLTQMDATTGWTSYWPCCASGSTAERLGAELEDGQHIVVTSAKLCYRKRQTQKHGEVSRMEVLVWQVDRPSDVTPAHTPAPESSRSPDEAAFNLEPARGLHGDISGEGAAALPKKGKPRACSLATDAAELRTKEP